MRLYFSNTFTTILLAIAFATTMVPPAHASSESAVFNALDKGHYDKAINLANKSRNNTLLYYAYWSVLTDVNAAFPSASLSSLLKIIRATKDWPLHSRARIRVEEAVFTNPGNKRDMAAFCKDFPPISGYGMFACVNAQVLDKKTRGLYILQGWKQGDFSKADEQTILREFPKTLRYADHYARMDRLLFEGKHNAAKRLMPRMQADDKRLFQARMALRATARDANAKLAKVPSSQRIDPGIIFDRLQWRHKKGKTDGAIEMLLSAPKNPPYPDLWWKFRERYAREALGQGRVKEALRILADAGDLSRGNRAEALWLMGWITLEHRKDAKAAYPFFYELDRTVKFPISKARAAFWAGEAARRNNNLRISREWYQKAARLPMTFYGQVAHAVLYENRPLDISGRSSTTLSDSQIKRDGMFALIALLAKHGREKQVDQFLLHAANHTDSASRLAQLAALGRQVGERYNQVRVAKHALRSHVWLLEDGWPVFNLPKGLAIEPGLTLAITRQESEFDHKAKSRAGARGLMQLLPRTARDTARKIKQPYSLSRLWQPDYNVRIGSAYLGRLVDAYDGALVPSIAAYNAGPGNVRKWFGKYGEPEGNLSEVLTWMESIPFDETRNYVQRVLENLQIYRARQNPKAPNRILRDLKGS